MFFGSGIKNMDNSHQIIAELKNTFGEETITEQQTVDGLPTVWLSEDKAIEVLSHLRTDIERPLSHTLRPHGN